MCDYSELRNAGVGPIRNPMHAEELKSLVESGHYKPDPSQIAMAMLQRRGVRELLVHSQPGDPADRNPPPPDAPRQAA